MKLYGFWLQVAGRLKLKVTTTYFWKERNTGLMNLGDLSSPAAAATFWALKVRSGNWT